MAPRIVWDTDAPAEIVAVVDPLLRELVDAFPGWCYEVRCGYDSDGDNGAMYTRVNVEYRWVRINTCAAFLQWEPARRRDSVLHEIIHTSLQPLANVVHDLLSAADLPESLKKWAEEQLRMANEGATCDLTEAILRLTTEPRSDNH